MKKIQYDFLNILTSIHHHNTSLPRNFNSLAQSPVSARPPKGDKSVTGARSETVVIRTATHQWD